MLALVLIGSVSGLATTSAPTTISVPGGGGGGVATADQLLSSPSLTYGKLRVHENVIALCCGIGGAVWRRWSFPFIVLFVREAIREGWHKPPRIDELETPVGRYVDLNGVSRVHVVEGGRAGEAVIHCSHGFGANSLSFRSLFEDQRARWVAHDHPGFGLTRRPRRIKDYVLDGGTATELGEDCFVGHSMGAISALDAALRKKATRLVLLAPALSTNPRPSPSFPKTARLGASWPWRLPTTLILRRLVHSSRKFWHRALGACWSKQSRLLDAVGLERTAKGYALPSFFKGWEVGLLKFSAARLFPSSSHENVREAANATHLNILIIHGDEDPVVPLRNSRALQALFGDHRSTLLVLPNVGHCPHEERPDLVANAIHQFVTGT